MPFEFALTLVFLFIGVALAVIWLFGRWRKRDGRTSAFASDNSIEEVGMTALSLISFRGATKRVDGKIEHRPTFGVRIIGPAIAGVLIYWMGERAFMESVSPAEPTLSPWVIYGFWALLLYTVLQLNFVQRVVYDEKEIEVYGVDLRGQRRDLTDLVEIETHVRRGSLVLIFANQKRVHVPNMLDDRAGFVAAMKSIAEANRARGLTVPPQGLAASLGF